MSKPALENEFEAASLLEVELSGARAAGITFAAILAAHLFIDALAAIVPASLGLLEARLMLRPEQSAWLLGLGSLTSGLAQPACALVSDRLGTRTLGVLGIALAAMGIGSLGLATNMVSLALIYVLGMIGVGMFHPIGAATAGELKRHRRTSAVSLFFVAGMLGGVLGAMLGPRLLALPGGFGLLPWVMVPTIAVAIYLGRNFATLLPSNNLVSKPRAGDSMSGSWSVVGILYVAAAMRFCVNMALLYLFVRWSQGHIQSVEVTWTVKEVARAAAPINGNLNGATLVGMALGGLAAGVFVRPGGEKWPMVLVPIVFAPVIALFPYMTVGVNYLLAMLAGIGFSSMIPVTIALAQRLLPHRANLASSLMMGGAWAVAMVGPRAAEFGVARVGLTNTFLATALVLAASGLVCLAVRVPEVRDSPK